MKVEDAIKKAVEGGYSRPEIIVCHEEGRQWHEAIINRNAAFLDAAFWQSLGKALGWYQGEKWGVCPNCKKDEYYGSQKFCMDGGGEIDHYFKIKSMKDCGQVRHSWLAYWHRFIDHLADGKTAEECFENLQ